MRVPVTAYLGATEFARFHVDLVAGLAMTGVPEVAAPLVPVELPGIVSICYRVYRLATTSPPRSAHCSRFTLGSADRPRPARATAISPTWWSSPTPKPCPVRS